MYGMKMSGKNFVGLFFFFFFWFLPIFGAPLSDSLWRWTYKKQCSKLLFSSLVFFFFYQKKEWKRRDRRATNVENALTRS